MTERLSLRSSHIRIPSWAKSVSGVHDRIDMYLGICQNPEDVPASGK
jgi:hypothetical protein